MTPSEIGAVLALAAARDRRTVGEADILAWGEDLDGVTFDEARQAVRRHYRQTSDWLMPSHINAWVKVIREERRRAERRNLPALPSKFEEIPERLERNRRGRAMCDAAISRTASPS